MCTLFKKLNHLLLLIMTLAPLSMAATKSMTAYAVTDSTVVFIDPSSIRDLQPQATFSIALKIGNVTNLYGLDIQFKWDPTILEYINHTVKIPVETYPDGVLHNPILPIKDEVNATGGTYWVAYASMSPAAPFNGTGTVFELTLKVKGIGRSLLEISSCDLADMDGTPIPHTNQNGYFSNYVPQPVNIAVSPPKIIDSTLTPSHNFTINISVENIIDLYGFNFSLSYNSSLIEPTSIQINQAFPPSQTVKLQQEGDIRIEGWLQPPAPSLSGNITLATIEFHINSTGATVLDLYNVQLKDSFNEAIPTNEPVDGYFNNMLITRMLVSPSELIDPKMKLGDTFPISIALENAIDMYDYAFKLSYDTNVLNCLGAVVIPQTNETHFTTQIQINDTAGTVWVYVQYYPPANPITIQQPQNVTQIIFQVQNYGQTPLTLNETRISDQNGNLISHEVENGFFATLMRDVAIVSVKVVSQNIVYPGRIVTIEVVAMNRGNMTTETFNVTLYANNTSIEVKTVTVEPWSNITLTYYWNTTGLTPCSNFTISAKASEVPYELDVNNNIYYDSWVKIKMIGDINGDGIIDIYDVVEVTSIYYHKLGDPDWNPDADLAPPWGIIDIFDLVTVSSKYGQKCS